MALSNNITAFLNFIVIVFFIVIHCTSLPHDRIYCIFGSYLDIIRIFILLIAFAGLVGALGNRVFLVFYNLVILALLFLVLATFFTFGLMVATENYSGVDVPHRGYKEYNLRGYSSWFQPSEIMNSDIWSKIKTCVLGRSDVCSKLGQEYGSADQFFSSHLSPIQSGCCKPPSICNFQYVKATLWLNANATTPSAVMDCNLWSNNQTLLCYGCDACKAGFMGNLMMEWKKIEVILAVAFFILLLVYVIGGCALGNVQNKVIQGRTRNRAIRNNQLNL